MKSITMKNIYLLKSKALMIGSIGLMFFASMSVYNAGDVSAEVAQDSEITISEQFVDDSEKDLLGEVTEPESDTVELQEIPESSIQDSVVVVPKEVTETSTNESVEEIVVEEDTFAKTPSDSEITIPEPVVDDSTADDLLEEVAESELGTLEVQEKPVSNINVSGDATQDIKIAITEETDDDSQGELAEELVLEKDLEIEPFVQFATGIQSMCTGDTPNNILKNGGFEDFVVEKDWKLFNNNDINPWQVEWIPGNGGEDVGPATLEIQKGLNDWSAAEGNQYAELDTHGKDDQGATLIELRQDLITVPGIEYKIFYQGSARPNTKAKENDFQMEVINDDGSSLILENHNLGEGDSDVNWKPFEYSFTANGELTSLIFRGQGPGNSLGAFLDDVHLCGPSESIGETGIITSPVKDNDVVSGLTTLTAEYFDGDDENDDAVQWAVRAGSCAPNLSNNIYGNVGGLEDVADWDGANFSFSFNANELDPTQEYCFVFNPTDDGDTDVRETRLFNVEVDQKPVLSNSASELTLTVGDDFTDPGAIATDVEDDDTELTSKIIVAGETVNQNVVGTYVITYNVQDSAGNNADEITLTVIVQEANNDNDDGGTTGSRRRSGGGGGGSTASPQVLGAETVFGADPQVLGAELVPEMCPVFTEFMQRGDYDGDGNTTEVSRLQEFLNNHLGATLVVDGIFGSATESSVHAFQQMHFDKIISPWNLSERTTGWFYKTSRVTANEILGCYDRAFLEDPAVEYLNDIAVNQYLNKVI